MKNYHVQYLMGLLAVACLYVLFLAIVVYPPRFEGAPLPFTKPLPPAPTGKFPVGRWEIAAYHGKEPTYFTIEFRQDGTGWVRLRENNYVVMLRWKLTEEDGYRFIDVEDEHKWGFWVNADLQSGKLAGNRMTMRGLP